MSGGPAAARRGRSGAARPVRTGPWLGRELEVDVGPVAHGGHCVARHEGRVLFVRHALPGERVLALVTEDGGGSFCRADAVRVLTAAPERVVPPCPHAGPGRCGGCDWQHATGAAQRAGKAAVVREQLARLAGLPDVPVLVEALPAAGADDLLGWRSRVRFAVDATGRTGLRRHRSHELEPVAHCPLGTAAVTAAGVGERSWPGVAEVEVVASTTGDTTVLVRPADTPDPGGAPGPGGVAGPDGGLGPGGAAGPDGGSGPGGGSGPDGRDGRGPDGRGRDRRGRDRGARRDGTAGDGRLGGEGAPGGDVHSGPRRVRERAGDRDWQVDAAGFWQVHPAAADALGRCVLEMLAPRPGETALDLYAGAGLFAGLLAAAVGPTGRVVAVESDPTAAADAAANLAGLPVEVRPARVTAGLLGGLGLAPDLAVLDPPRSGAGREVLLALLALAPRAVAYVACDPAALARDLRAALDAGYELRALRAFDCFPNTHHVETVALLAAAGR